MPVLVTALGWVGAVTCLVAYVLVSRGRWAPTSGRYQAANLVSGLLMGLVAATSGVWPSVATNAVWAVVGAHAVTTLLRARRRPEPAAQRPPGDADATGTARPDPAPAATDTATAAHPSQAVGLAA